MPCCRNNWKLIVWLENNLTPFIVFLLSTMHYCLFTKLLPFLFRLVGNLLGVNLFSTLVLIPLICLDISPSKWWNRSDILNHPIRCLISELVSTWVSNASMLGTLLIGLDQYLAVMFPLRWEACSQTFCKPHILVQILVSMTVECKLFFTRITIHETIPCVSFLREANVGNSI